LQFNNNSLDISNENTRPRKYSKEIHNKNRENSKDNPNESCVEQVSSSFSKSPKKSPKNFKFELKSVLSLSKEDQIELFNQFDIDSSGDLD